MFRDDTTLNTGAAMANVAFALSRGLSADELHEATGVSCYELLNPHTRSPEHMMPNILALLAEKFPGEPFALEMAQSAPFSYFGGLANGAQFAYELRDAIALLVENSSLIADQLEISFSEAAACPQLISHHPMDHIDDGRSHEVGMGLVTRLFSEFLGVSDCLEHVTFKHEPNCDETYYVKVFGVPVDFNQSETALYFKREKLSFKIKHGNVNLFNYVKTHLSIVQKQIDIFKEPREMTMLQKAAIENVMAGVFTTAAVAAAANMSLRTAQRISSEHGTSIQELIDNVREKRAKELLVNERNELSAISFILGYSDERSFRRAFRRWTGKSPSDFRANQK